MAHRRAAPDGRDGKLEDGKAALRSPSPVRRAREVAASEASAIKLLVALFAAELALWSFVKVPLTQLERGMGKTQGAALMHALLTLTKNSSCLSTPCLTNSEPPPSTHSLTPQHLRFPLPSPSSLSQCFDVNWLSIVCADPAFPCTPLCISRWGDQSFRHERH
jgi:hypothetical protein